MKKKRLFYLDFIRMIATVSILITHFNALYIYMVPKMLEKSIITSYIGNIYIGSWGVSLFFIISGSSLMYVYQDGLELKSFYKKRFLSIYPMFWIAYIIAFLALFLKNQTLPGGGVPKYRFLLTIFGFDGLLSSAIPTFYLLGEWFLGAIILLYILFPLLRKLMNEHPIALGVGVMVIYLMFVIFYKAPYPLSTIILVRLPEILFGMYMVKYKFKIKWPVAVASFLIIVANTILQPELVETIQTTYIGIASFIILVYVSNFFARFKGIGWFSSLISKYSYAIFLVHHVLIHEIAAQFDLQGISVLKSYILFAAICMVIAIASKLLYELHKTMMKTYRDIYAQQSTKE